MTETYFGDKNTFAIRYIPSDFDATERNTFAYCHLVINGQILGNKEESCYLSTWKYAIHRLQEKIKNDFDLLWHSEFENRNDIEIFELIWKANQQEEDYNPQFTYLPALENEIWSNCHIAIDETIDAFLIAIVKQQNDQIKFLWQGWRALCPEDKIDKLYSIVVDKNFVVETIEECLNTIEKN